MTRAATAGASRSSARPKARSVPDTYLARTELPLTSLVFLLPLIILYELGTRAFLFDPVHQVEQRIIAFDRMQKFFLALGAPGRYMPALAVVIVLLACHVARQDPWKVRLRHVLGMVLESLVLALPLIVLCTAANRYLAHVTLAGQASRIASTKGLLVLSLGAGVYEELMFRLVGFTVLSFLLVDVLAINKKVAALLIVSICALLFSGYHYLDGQPFRVWTFAFRTLAGMYFGAVFLCRGFGITAGCHAAYDVCVVALTVMG